MQFTVSLTSLAAILWSGMLIISGSIWVLSSQVRRLVDHMEEQSKAGMSDHRSIRRALNCPTAPVAREVVRRVVERSASRVN
jgi:DNA-binding GntR family transcriptional regulator